MENLSRKLSTIIVTITLKKTILNKTNKRLDQILEMGTATLDDIDQNQILTRVQGKMTSTLKTLGVNADYKNKINKVVLKDTDLGFM